MRTNLLPLIALSLFTSLATARGHGWYEVPPTSSFSHHHSSNGAESLQGDENPFAPQSSKEVRAVLTLEDTGAARRVLVDPDTMVARILPEDARASLQENGICWYPSQQGCFRNPL